MDDEDELDPLTKKYLYWFLIIAIVVIAYLYFTAPAGIKHYQRGGDTSYSPTYTTLPPGSRCAGHWEVVSPNGEYKVVCVYP